MFAPAQAGENGYLPGGIDPPIPLPEGRIAGVPEGLEPAILETHPNLVTPVLLGARTGRRANGGPADRTK